MKPSLATLTLLAGCALMGTHAFAQSAATPRVETTAPITKSAAAPKALTAAASTKTAGAAATVLTVTAAGSVVILADGIVANATIAQIQPPAPGFVYER